ncbi:Mitochondrial ATPase complex subunit ATP10 [Leucoagaricus sp. SymC.cos]|nr:Mitochondrial ATPase complex subunit ATP10 [Leucoagaricus sp. SymC.cos]
MSLFTWPVRILPAKALRRPFASSPHLLNSLKPTSDPLATIGGPDAPPKDALPPLSRPLGVRQRPTTLIKSTTDRLKELMDTDVRMAQRRHLIKEASVGYFHDLNMTRKHGGKTWIAPRVLIREDKALYLPNITGKSLDTGAVKNSTEMCFGKVTVLAMLGTRVSEINAKGFVNPTHVRYASHPPYQYVQVNLQENVLKSFLVNIFLNSLRKVIPKELHPTYLVSTQNMEYVRDALGMTNSRVGYVFLIDENLKIRWGGCANATDEEARSLESCTGVLLKRFERKKPMKSGEPSTALEPTPAEST